MKKVIVGQWDGEQYELEVEDSATVGDVLRTAHLTPGSQQSITAFSDASTVRANEVARNGETYLLTGNHVSGFYFFMS
jgi:hypothetical protein